VSPFLPGKEIDNVPDLLLSDNGSHLVVLSAHYDCFQGPSDRGAKMHHEEFVVIGCELLFPLIEPFLWNLKILSFTENSVLKARENYFVYSRSCSVMTFCQMFYESHRNLVAFEAQLSDVLKH
jgi:hypothetical protein